MLKRPSKLPPRFRAVLLAGLLAAACAGERDAVPERANLLLVTLDTVRADRLGAYGYAPAETPWLDRLAREGLRFDQASSAVPLTLPSHASLLSGLLPPHHGLRNNGAGTFPDGPRHPGHAALRGRLPHRRLRRRVRAGPALRPRPRLRGLRRRDRARPRRHRGPRSRAARRARSWTGPSPGSGQDRSASPSSSGSTSTTPTPRTTRPRRWRERHAGRPYDGEIAAVDEQVGRLLQDLERRGLAGRTVVVVAADHGEGLGDHGEQTHGLLLYEPPCACRSWCAARASRAGWCGRRSAWSTSRRPWPAFSAAALFRGRALTAATSPPPCGRAGSRPPADLYAESRTRRSSAGARSPPCGAATSSTSPRPIRSSTTWRRDPGETRDLSASLREPAPGGLRRAAWPRSRPARSRPSTSPADAETRARLAALGYTAGPAPKPPAGADAATRGPARASRSDLFQRFERAHHQVQAGQTAAALAELEALVAADPRQPGLPRQARPGLAGARRDRPRRAALPAGGRGRSRRSGGLVQPRRRPAGSRAAGEAREALERAVHLDPAPARGPQHAGDRPPGARGSRRRRAQEFELAVAARPAQRPRAEQPGQRAARPGPLDEAERRLPAGRWRPLRATPSPGTASARWRWSAIGPLPHSPILSGHSDSPRLSRGPPQPGHRPASWPGRPEAAAAAYREFLAATAEDPRYSEQRRAAQQLLARLSNRAMGLAPNREEVIVHPDPVGAEP